MDEIEGISRAFLWTGVPLNRHWALVSWVEVCKPIRNGGLGIRNLKAWNATLLLKLVWAFEKEMRRLWIKWVSDYYLKGSTVWDIVPTLNSSYA